MQRIKSSLVLRKDDYEILISYVRGALGRSLFDKRNAAELESELKKAKLVNKDKFPDDVVGINSRVTIQEENESKLMDVTLVTPDKADIKQRKISVMSPIGTALIGFRKGQKVKWNVPAGEKTFTILAVTNQ